jgi:hypothetical protein
MSLTSVNPSALVVHPTVWTQLTIRFLWGSLQHQMNRQCVGQCVGWFVSTVKWGGRQRHVASDELAPRKSIASDHPMVLLSAAFSQPLHALCVLSTRWRDPKLWVPKDSDYEWLSQPQWPLGIFGSFQELFLWGKTAKKPRQPGHFRLAGCPPE